MPCPAAPAVLAAGAAALGQVTGVTGRFLLCWMTWPWQVIRVFRKASRSVPGMAMKAMPRDRSAIIWGSVRASSLISVAFLGCTLHSSVSSTRWARASSNGSSPVPSRSRTITSVHECSAKCWMHSGIWPPVSRARMPSRISWRSRSMRSARLAASAIFSSRASRRAVSSAMMRSARSSASPITTSSRSKLFSTQVTRSSMSSTSGEPGSVSKSGSEPIWASRSTKRRIGWSGRAKKLASSSAALNAATCSRSSCCLMALAMASSS